MGLRSRDRLQAGKVRALIDAMLGEGCGCLPALWRQPPQRPSHAGARQYTGPCLIPCPLSARSTPAAQAELQSLLRHARLVQAVEAPGGVRREHRQVPVAERVPGELQHAEARARGEQTPVDGHRGGRRGRRRASAGGGGGVQADGPQLAQLRGLAGGARHRSQRPAGAAGEVLHIHAQGRVGVQVHGSVGAGGVAVGLARLDRQLLPHVAQQESPILCRGDPAARGAWGL